LAEHHLDPAAKDKEKRWQKHPVADRRLPGLLQQEGSSPLAPSCSVLPEDSFPGADIPRSQPALDTVRVRPADTRRQPAEQN
jgi:hypothetical protein